MIALLLALLPAATDPYGLHQVEAAYAGAHLDYSVRWQECPETNAWYSPDTHVITLCNQLRDGSPGALRFIYAHELAHAVIHQWSVPFTGSEEAAADELAALTLSLAGMAKDVEAVAYYFAQQDPVTSPFDPHPPYHWRAGQMLCFAREALKADVPRGCDPDQANRAYRNWVVLTSGR